MANTTPNPVALLNDFRQRRDCCRILLELAQEQAALVGQAAHPELIELINRKQHLVNRLTELRVTTDPAGSWTQVRQQLATEVREECQRLLVEAEEYLRKLLTLEAACIQQMQEEAVSVRREMQTVLKATHLRNLYQAPSGEKLVEVHL